MAVPDLVSRTWLREFLRTFDQQNVYVPLARNITGSIAGGNEILYPKDDTDYSGDLTEVSDAHLTGGTVAQLAWGTPDRIDAETVSFKLDKHYRYQRLVSVLEQENINANFLTQVAQREGRRYANFVNKLGRTAYTAGTIDKLPDIAVTAANFSAGTNAAFRTAILKSFENADLAYSYGNLYVGRQICVMSPRMARYLRNILRDEKIPFQTEINDGLVINNRLGRYEGWDIIVDTSAGDGVANTDDNKHTMIFCIMGEGMVYGERRRGPMTIPFNQNQTSMGTEVRGLNSIKFGVVQKDTIRRQLVVIS